MDFGLSYVDGPIQWRWPIAFQAFFAICLVLQMLPLPETPRFLIEKDLSAEAASVLARLDGTSVDDIEVLDMVQTIQVSIEKETRGGPFQYKELLQGGPMGNFRRIVLCCAVNVMQQFTGSNMINASLEHPRPKEPLKLTWATAAVLRPHRLRADHGPNPHHVAHPRWLHLHDLPGRQLHPALGKPLVPLPQSLH